MVSIRIKDNRYGRGFKIKRFDENEVTPKIVDFVESNPKAYAVTVHGLWMTRNQFLEQYNMH